MAAVKQPRALGELQLKAEAAKTTTQDTPEQLTREQLLTQIWKEMRALKVLGGLISHDHDDIYRA
jgi:hypothetical protein